MQDFRCLDLKPSVVNHQSNGYKRALKKIADVLIEKETLEQEEFVALLKPYKIRPVAVKA